jgi:hypothetical protein
MGFLSFLGPDTTARREISSMIKAALYLVVANRLGFNSFLALGFGQTPTYEFPNEAARDWGLPRIRFLYAQLAGGELGPETYCVGTGLLADCLKRQPYGVQTTVHRLASGIKVGQACNYGTPYNYSPLNAPCRVLESPVD